MVYRVGKKVGRHVTRVTLDGRDVRVSCCIYADTRRGVLRSIVRTGDGQALLHPNGREILKAERRGKVRVYANGKRPEGTHA